MRTASRTFRAQCHALLCLQLLVACSAAPSETTDTRGSAATAEHDAIVKGPAPPPKPPPATLCSGWTQYDGTAPPCVACGGPGQTPCMEPSAGEYGCDGWYQPSTATPATCQPCGGLDQIMCLVDAPDGQLNGAGEIGCQAPLVQWVYDGITTETCVTCGYTNQQACAGSTCVEGNMVNASGTCVACGENGQPACTNSACTGGCDAMGCSDSLVTVNGVCVPLQQVTWTSAALGGSGVDTNSTNPVQLTVTNTGNWWFSGGVNNSSPINQNYSVGCALSATNGAGQHFAQGFPGSVMGEFSSNNNSGWSFGGVDTTVPGYWEAVSQSTMDCKMGVGTSFTTVLDILMGLAVTTIAVIFGGQAAKNGVTCQGTNPPGGAHCVVNSSP